jgi:hypothetical protein
MIGFHAAQRKVQWRVPLENVKEYKANLQIINHCSSEKASCGTRSTATHG